jgi:hydrogenase maturation protease
MVGTLVIGYGNVYREDDGVAYEVIVALRRRLGQEPLDEEEIDLEQLSQKSDTGTAAVLHSTFVPQLAPDLLDVAAEYGRLVFVDAHVQPEAEDLECSAVQPEYAAAAFTHHMTPAMFLALLQTLYHREVAGFAVSIRGHSFDFRRGLSAAAQALVEPAVEEILELSSPSQALAVPAR